MYDCALARVSVGGGSIVDLNDLIPSSDFRLSCGFFINDGGEIAGIGFLPGCEASDPIVCGHAYLLIPCDDGHPNVESCDYSLVEATSAAQRPAEMTQGRLN
jgi:hypothetical protein